MLSGHSSSTAYHQYEEEVLKEQRQDSIADSSISCNAAGAKT